MKLRSINVFMAITIFIITFGFSAAFGADTLDKPVLLTASDADSDYGDSLGISSCISGNYAIIGASGDEGKGTAYIFGGPGWGQDYDKIDADDTIRFGISVSISEDYAIVGDDQGNGNGVASGTAYVFRQGQNGWFQDGQKLVSTDHALNDKFGYSVSISGNYAIIGAYGDDDNGQWSGSAYIFMKSGSNWIQQAKLTADDGDESDHFGESVSISDDYAVVGASWDDVEKDDNRYSNAGSAYIFKRKGELWEQVAKLNPKDIGANNRFGNSVSITGNHAIIGAKGHDGIYNNKTDSGAAYVFGQTFILDKKSLAASGVPSDVITGLESIAGYGYDSEDALMNAIQNIIGSDQAAEYSSQFVKSAETVIGQPFILNKKMLEANGVPADIIAKLESIAADEYDDEKALTDAVRPAIGVENAATYEAVLIESAETWRQKARLYAYDGDAGDSFGSSVSISEAYAVVGAVKNNGTGSAYVFFKPENGWSKGDEIKGWTDLKEDNKLIYNDSSSGDEMGCSVSVSGSIAVVSADEYDNSRGIAYVYDIKNPLINLPPMISNINDMSIRQDITDKEINFSISDPETPVLNLSILATSSNTAIATVTTPSCASSNCQISVTSNSLLGDTEITITATETLTGGKFNISTESFILTVSNPPIISGLPEDVVSINDDDVYKEISFSVEDVEGGTLTIKAASDRPDLFPDSHIKIDGRSNNVSVSTTAGKPEPLTMKIYPAEGGTGSTEISVTVTDSSGKDSTTETFNVRINAGPEIKPIDDISITEDSTGEVEITVMTSSQDTVTLSASSDKPELVPADSQHININGNGLETSFSTNPNEAKTVSMKITPAAGMYGDTIITVYATDTNLKESRETFKLTVTSDEDPPRIDDILYNGESVIDGEIEIQEDDSTDTIEIKASDEDGDIKSLSATSSNQYLITNEILAGAINGTDRLNFVEPLENKYGIATIFITIEDEGGRKSETKKFDIKVTSVNDKPVLVDFPETEDIPKLTEGKNDETCPLFSIKDIDGDKLTLTISSSNSDLIPNNTEYIKISNIDAGCTSELVPETEDEYELNCSVDVEPGQEQNIELTISPPEEMSNTADTKTDIRVEITDPDGLSVSDHFKLEVTAVNDPPVIGRITNTETGEDILVNGLQIDEDSETGIIELEINDTDKDLLTVSVTAGDNELIPEDGISIGAFGASTSVSHATYSAGPLQLTFKPLENAHGSSTITVTVTDGQDGSSDIEIFAINVNPINDTPTIKDIQNVPVDETLPPNDPAEADRTFMVNDADKGDTLTVSLESLNTGVVPQEGIEIISGANDNGEVTVGSNPDGEQIGIRITPLQNEDRTGPETAKIKITVTDDEGASVSENMLLTVNHIGRAPTITITDMVETEEDTVKSIDFTVDDQEKVALKITAELRSSYPDGLFEGALSNYISIDNRGSYVYPLYKHQYEDNTSVSMRFTPPANKSGTAVIRVTVADHPNDVYAMTSFADITYTINPVNDPPEITKTSASVEEDQLATVDVKINDAEGGILKINVKSDHKTLFPDENISYLDGEDSIYAPAGTEVTIRLYVQPAENETGSGNITVTAEDESGEVGEMSIPISVAYKNDAPEIAPIDSIQINEDQTTEVDIVITDPEGGALRVEVTSGDDTLFPPDERANIDIEDGFGSEYLLNMSKGGGTETLKLKLKPALNETGTAKITIKVSDRNVTPEEVTTSTDFLVSVKGINDAPEIAEIPNVTANENTPTENIKITVKDPEGDNLTVTVTSKDPLLVPNSSDNIDLDSGFGMTRVLTDLTDSNPERDLNLIITPATGGESDKVTMEVTVEDGINTTKQEFYLVFENKNPVLPIISSQSTDEDIELKVPFTVSDLEGGKITLSVTVDDGDETLIPEDSENLNFIVNGLPMGKKYQMLMGKNETVSLELSILPAENESGVATVLISAQDGDNTAESEFFVSVNPVNDKPVIEPISKQIVETKNTPIDNIKINVSDQEGGTFAISVLSKDENLVRNDDDHIDIQGFGLNPPTMTFDEKGSDSYDLKITPVTDATGSAEIVVRAEEVSTGIFNEISFIFGVDVQKPELIGLISPQKTDEDKPIDIVFSVTDAQGGFIEITASSGNDEVVKNDYAHININGYGPDKYTVELSPNEIREVTMTITPVEDAFGNPLITVTADDGSDGVPIPEEFILMVEPVNDKPEISDIEDQYTNENDIDETKHIDITFKVKDLEGANDAKISVSAEPLSEEDDIVVPNDRDHINIDEFGTERTVTLGTEDKEFNLVITPAGGKAGRALITVTADDGSGTETAVETETFILNVSDENAPPQITGVLPVMTLEDTPKELIFTVSDTEGSDDMTLRISSNSDIVPDGDEDENIDINGFGTRYPFSLSEGGSVDIPVTITPAEDAVGTADITLEVSDGTDTASKTFVFRVNEVNDEPELLDLKNYDTLQETSVDIPFRLKDKEGGNISISVTSEKPELIDSIKLGDYGSSHTYSIAKDTPHEITMTITPADGKTGSTIIYVSADDNSETDTAVNTEEFILHIADQNDEPEISYIDPNQTTPEDTTKEISFTVTDAEGGTFPVKVELTDVNPAGLFPTDTDDNVVEHISINGFYPSYTLSGMDPEQTANLVLKLTPEKNTSGTATVTITVEDGDTSATASFVLKVEADNDAPTIEPIGNKDMSEGESKDITINVTDNEGGDVTVSVTSSNPTVVDYDNIDIEGFGHTRTKSLVAKTPTAFDMTITPADGESANNITITVTATDGTMTSDPQTFNLNVGAINSEPEIDYIPSQIIKEGESAEFIIKVTDDLGGTLPVSISSSSNTDLVSLEDKDGHLNIQGYGRYYDITGMQPNETVELTLKVTPGEDKFGTTKLEVKVEDGDKEATRSFQLRVDPVNDEPTITQITNKYYPENPVEIDVNDLEGGSMAVSVTSSNPELIPNTDYNIDIDDGFGSNRMISVPENNSPASFNLQLTPATAKTGYADITVTVTDGDGDDAVTQDMTFKYTVGEDAVNQPPKIESITFDPSPVTNEDFPITAYVTISDPDGDAVTISATSEATSDDDTELIPNKDVNIDFNGYGKSHTTPPLEAITTVTLTITPVEDKSGSGMITVKLDDGKDEDSRSFEVKVNPLNDLPVISPIQNQEPVDSQPVEDIEIKVTDVEGGEMTIEVTSSNEELVPNTDYNINIDGFGSTHTVTVPKTTKTVTRDLTLIPVANVKSFTVITVKVTDQDNIVTRTFNLTTDDMDTPPSISFIKHQETNEDEYIDVSFTVTDKEGGGLTITAKSADTDIVPDDDEHLNIDSLGKEYILTLSPSQVADMTLRITPEKDKSGAATITVSVDDGNNDPVSSIFQLGVIPGNDPPVISDIGNHSTDKDNPYAEIEFTLTDEEGGQVTLSVSSDDDSIVPDSAISIDGVFGNSRTLSLDPETPKTVNLKITPLTGQSGTPTITVKVDDQNETIDKEFVLTVNKINEAPIITADILEAIEENEETYFSFNISDKEGGELLVSVESDYEKLVPNEYAHISIYGPDSDAGGSGTKYALHLPDNSSSSLQVWLKPVINESGEAEMTIKVEDADSIVTKTFTFVVRDVPVPPTILVDPLQVTNEDIEKVVRITVSDPDDSVADLIVTHQETSDPDNIISTIKHGGSGADRTLTITPTAERFGEAEIRVTVSDGTSTDTETFTFKVNPVNDEPTISTISSPKIAVVNTPININFRIDDVETEAQYLEVIGYASKDTDSVIKGMNLSGADADRRLTITPANKAGEATITINVDDGSANTTVDFTLMVIEDPIIITDNPPVIEGITSPKYVKEDEEIIVNFTVSDPDTPVANLIVNAVSLTPETVPNGSNMTLESSGVNRTLKITPGPHKYGDATIRITADDSSSITAAEFTLKVIAVNDAPYIYGIPASVKTDENKPVYINFSLNDMETPLQDLKVSAYSSNITLIPAGNISVDHNDSYTTYTLTVFPVSNMSDRATITIAVTDDSYSANSTSTKAFMLTVGTVQDGDVDNNGTVDMADAIIVLKILAGIHVADINMGADVNSDYKIGIHELYYILRYVAVAQ
ncbi:MAG: tandem-95 repeat protein [Desulfobacteraceae bacterium]|nr:tandem-95 repeat protein [Desulfobacteraceae bacterium]